MTDSLYGFRLVVMLVRTIRAATPSLRSLFPQPSFMVDNNLPVVHLVAHAKFREKS